MALSSISSSIPKGAVGCRDGVFARRLTISQESHDGKQVDSGRDQTAWGLDRQGQGGGREPVAVMREKHKDSTTNREIALARRLREMAHNRRAKGKN